MKIIHCADLHIDCKTKFSAEKRNIIRNQLLQSFVDMVDFAEKNKVAAILLCGDIFEDRKPLKRSLKVLQDCISSHKNIQFFHVWGNHDENIKIFDKSQSNYICFGTTFSKVDFGDISIGGVSFRRQYGEEFYDSIDFDKNDFNIFMMHTPVETGKYSEPLILKKVSSKYIDYLAMGHIHDRCEGSFGKRGTWAFSGCMNSTSFSDLGVQGFELLDISNGKLTKQFVPFSKYDFNVIEVDISNLSSINEVEIAVENVLKNYGENDILRIVFVGKKTEDLVVDCASIEQLFKNKVFYLEVFNKSRLIFDLKKYAAEKLSLKAEFVNTVFNDDTLTEEQKQQICSVGIEVLKGEEVHL